MPISSWDELYPRLYPVIALRKHGALYPWWIWRDYGTFVQMTHWYYPYNPRTDLQQAWRAVMAGAVANWQGFDEGTKEYYNQLVKGKSLIGYMRYCGMYLRANYPPE